MRPYEKRSTHGVDPFMMLLTEGIDFSMSSVETRQRKGVNRVDPKLQNSKVDLDSLSHATLV